MLAMTVTTFLMLCWNVWWSKRMEKRASIMKHSERLEEHGVRIIKLEAAVGNIPTRVASHQDVDVVHKRVTEVKADVKGMMRDVGELMGSVNGMRKTLSAINEALLKKE